MLKQRFVMPISATQGAGGLPVDPPPCSSSASGGWTGHVIQPACGLCMSQAVLCVVADLPADPKSERKYSNKYIEYLYAWQQQSRRIKKSVSGPPDNYQHRK